MKRIKKQIVFILIVSMVCLATQLNVKASEINANKASEEFIKLCNEFYANPLKYKVIDFQNQDVSQKFYENVRSEYSNAIVHAFQKFRAPFSGKIVHIFPEQSAVI